MRARSVPVSLALALLAAALLPAAGCSSGDDEAERFGRFRPRDEQVLYFNNFEEPEYIDPGLLTGHPDSFVAMQLFEALTEPHPKTLAPRPAAATSWSVQDGGRRYRFELRKDARWSDGTPVTAHDFIYAWERVLRPSTAARYSYQLYAIRNARAYNTGRVKRVVGKHPRPRRPPFVLLAGDRPPEAPGLRTFAPGAVVELLDSNLRVPAGERAVELREQPDDAAPILGPLDPGETGLVVARKLPAHAVERPGEPVKGAWVQVRPPRGESAGWAREEALRPAFPSTNARRVEGLRRYEDRMPLRARPAEDADVISYADDDDEVELLAEEGEWGRVLHLGSGRTGFIPLEYLDDVAGDRHWFYVRVLDERQRGEASRAPAVDGGAPDGGPAADDAAADAALDAASRRGSVREGWLPGRYLFADASVLGVRADGDHALEVTLEEPTPYFLSLTSFSALRPVPRQAVERWGHEWTRPEHIVTSGPFHLVFHRPRDRMELVRSATYHGRDDVKLDRVVVYAVSDVHTNVNLFRAGYLDGMHSAKLPVELVAGLRDKRDYVAGPYLATYFLRLNTTVKPLDDARVRRALNLAIDKELLTERLLRGGQVAATHIVPPGLPGYGVVEGERYDPERAKALLAEAGFPGGEGFPRLEFLFNTSEDHRLIAEYVQRQWHDVLGVDVILANQEWKTYLKKLHSMDYQITRSGWIGDYLDPNTFLGLFVTDGGNNETGYANPAYDALIEAAAAETDPARRAALFQQAEAMLNRDVPVIPLFYYVNNFLLAPEVKGFYSNLLDEHPLKDVFIDPTAID